MSNFRYKGACTPDQAQSRVMQLEAQGYINISCTQTSSGWFSSSPEYLITANKPKKAQQAHYLGKPSYLGGYHG